MGCDIICELPDSLLTQILLYLPTKSSVRTSVLSTRWRSLWLSVPGLDLATYHFGCAEDFERFIDRFVEFNQGSCLHIMWYRDSMMRKNIYNIGRVMELIGTLLVDRGIQHLDVTSYPYNIDNFMLQNIYKSKTLVTLKLDSVALKNPECVVFLPCLKIMCLENLYNSKDGPLVVEKLISGSPVLEELELIRPSYISNQEVLLFLRYDCHSQPEDLRKPDIFCDFLTRISNVRHMVIRQWTLKGLYYYSKLALTPQFHNLYDLKADVSNTSLQLLLGFLESCPNLKNLILGFFHSMETRQIEFTNVPRCLISTLEYVEIKIWMKKDETGIIKLVNYFLENSAVLKKLTLSFKPPSITKQESSNIHKAFSHMSSFID